MPIKLYEFIEIPVKDIEARIQLPHFQRGLVWTTQKKNDFILTLKEGLPFGSILVYPETSEASSRLLILDGQQRLSTILEYRKKPLSFWKPINSARYKSELDKLNKLLPDNLKLDEANFDGFINEALSNQSSNQFNDYIDEVQSSSLRKQVRDLFTDIKNQILSYLDVNELFIPAIKFTGDKTRIADVFANLNKGGVPLSKYEVFSASFEYTKIQLAPAGTAPVQDEILNNVKQYYLQMRDKAEFDVAGFSEDELTATRTITLAELAKALGKYLQDHLKPLVTQTEKAASEMGFSLLGIAVNIHNKNLNELDKHFGYIQNNLELILEKTERICTNLNDAFSVLLKVVKSSKSDEYAPGLNTNFKTLSYFAALWNLDPDSNEYRTSLKNIRAYYLYDDLVKIWSNAGDERLYGYQGDSPRFTYLKPLEQSDFISAHENWNGYTQGINFSAETKAIAAIHANLTYLADNIPQGDSFEMEHIVARSILNQYESSGHRQIYGGCLGNCMFLPKQLNNKKKAKTLHDESIKTLYDVNGQAKYSKVIERSLYFSENEFSQIDAALERRDPESVNQLLRERGERVLLDTASKLLE